MFKRLKYIDKDALFLSLLILGPCVNYYLNGVIQGGFGMGSISMLVYIFLALIGVYSYKYINKVPYQVRLISIILTIMTLFSWAIFPPISNVILADNLNPLDSGILFLILYSVPLLIYASTVRNTDIVLKYMFFLSLPNVILAFISYYFMVFQPVEDAQIEYMTFAYNSLTSNCVCILYGFKYKKIYAYLPSIALLILIFFVGSRGTSVCFICFCLLLYLKYAKFSRNTFIFLFVFLLFMYVVIDNFEIIASSVSGIVTDLGTNAYALSRLMNGEFFDSSARDGIHDMLLSKLYDFPIGYGLFGDRYIYHLCGQDVSTSSYAHNFFVEIITHFGFVFGSLINVWVLFLIYRSYKCKNQSLSLLVLVLIPAGLIKLFFSGSYLLSFEFWPLIGLCLNRCKELNIR